MRVAISGAGNVGLHVADALTRSGHEVLIIEQDRGVAARAATHPGIEWHIGDACENSVRTHCGRTRSFQLVIVPAAPATSSSTFSVHVPT